MVVDSWIGSNVLDRVVLVLAHSHAVLLESTQCLLIKLKGINFAYSELCPWLPPNENLRRNSLGSRDHICR